MRSSAPRAWQHARPPEERGLRRTAWQLGLQTAGLVLLCLLLVGGVLYATVVDGQRASVDQALEQAVAGGAGSSDGDDAAVAPGVALAVLRDGRLTTAGARVGGLPDRSVLEAVAATGVRDQRTVDRPGAHYALLTVQDGEVVVQAGYDLFAQHQERERVLGALGLAGGVGVVLAALAGVWLAGRAVRPMAETLTLQRRFVADAGHELRTPLTLLSTRAQMVRRRLRAPTPPTATALADDLDGVVADTEALTAILEELLLAADTRTPLPQTPVRLADLAGQAVRAAAAEAERRGLRLVLRTTDVVLSAGSGAALQRAVTALVDNALDHARHQVDVTVAHEGRVAVVTVADDGPGITPEALPRVFTRFAGDRDRFNAPGGRRHYGLGLALVGEVAARHGGTVTAGQQPPPATGAVLRLRLPVGRR